MSAPVARKAIETTHVVGASTAHSRTPSAMYPYARAVLVLVERV